ncbi:hypothetical protein BKA80DRAFT_274738 [Phyllosticta citrichinensis]
MDHSELMAQRGPFVLDSLRRRSHLALTERIGSDDMMHRCMTVPGLRRSLQFRRLLLVRYLPMLHHGQRPLHRHRHQLLLFGPPDTPLVQGRGGLPARLGWEQERDEPLKQVARELEQVVGRVELRVGAHLCWIRPLPLDCCCTRGCCSTLRDCCRTLRGGLRGTLLLQYCRRLFVGPLCSLHCSQHCSRPWPRTTRTLSRRLGSCSGRRQAQCPG